MTDEEIYQSWIDHMTNNSGMKLTGNEHMMRMITSWVSPEEAAFTTGFPLAAKTIEEIAEIKQMDIPELKERVEALARKGMIYESIRGDSVLYRMWSFGEIFMRVPEWAGRDDEPFRTMVRHGNKWYPTMRMGGKADVHAGLRSIPINETVESPSQLLPFEDIVQVIDKYEFHSVSYCCCRLRYNLDPDYPDTPFPLETCLHFDELGRYIVKNGLGREITKEETREILKKSADAGLIHGLQNTEEAPETICNCDLEYCTMLRPYHQLGFDKSMDQSNYAVQVTPETCKACGLCVKRCPMDAIQMKFSAESTNKFRKAVVVDTDLCIGCGVCVHKCPAESITLKRKETITRSPETGMDLMRINYMAMQAARQKVGSDHQSSTTQVPQSIGDAFDMMALAFKPGAAAGIDVVFQFNISGDAGGDWFIIIKDQTCEIKKGLTDSPTTTIGISDEDYIKMLSKQVEPATLLSTGKLKIEGDMMKAQVLEQVFPQQ